MVTHLKAIRNITCYMGSHSLNAMVNLPPDTGERISSLRQPYRPVLDLPTPEGWNAELTLVIGYIEMRLVTCAETVTYPPLVTI